MGEQQEQSYSWDAEYDVVVVGSGAGALAGAVSAARAGLGTVVLEKTGLLGGTSAYSGGACWLPGSSVQQAAGLPDSTASAREYLQALLGDGDVERREAFLAEAPRVVETLQDALAFEWRAFPEYFAASGRVPQGRSLTPQDLLLEELGELAELVRPSVDRDRAGKSHRGDRLDGGRALIGRLLKAFDTAGGTIHLGHAVSELVCHDGRVVGVVAQSSAGPVRMRARRGVLLACGGFEGHEGARRRFGVPGEVAWSMAPFGANTGDALRAAVALGAATTLMDQAWLCPGIELPGEGAGFTLGFRGGLVVDQHGRRFANESLPYDRMGRAMAAHEGGVPAYVVFDSREGGNLPAITMPGGRPEEHLAAGTWVRAETLSELAAAIGVPSAALVATVERFNGFATAGVDQDFHRGEDPYDRFFASGDGPNKALVPVDAPPYYAARLVLSDLGTKGGLVTDAHARVLDEAGAAIPGLYAAGNTAASLTRDVYPAPGAPIGTAMAMASLAVTHMQEC